MQYGDWRTYCTEHQERVAGVRHSVEYQSHGVRGAMSLLLILIILLVLLGGGGFYAGGPRAGIGLGGLILIVIVILALTGRL